MDSPSHLRAVPQTRSEAFLDGFLEEDVVRRIHEDAMAYHMRLDRTIERMRQQFVDWDDMLGDYYDSPDQWMTLVLSRLGVAAHELSNMRLPGVDTAGRARRARETLLEAMGAALVLHELLHEFA